MMTDEVQWREEDGKYIAEVNGWRVTVSPSVSFPGEWYYTAFATCPTCGAGEGMGGGLRPTVTAAQAEGIELARRWRPKCARGLPRGEATGR